MDHDMGGHVADGCVLGPASEAQESDAAACGPNNGIAKPKPTAEGVGVVWRSSQAVAACLACNMCRDVLRDPVTAPECMHRSAEHKSAVIVLIAHDPPSFAVLHAALRTTSGQ